MALQGEYLIMADEEKLILSCNVTEESQIRKSRALIFAQTTPSNLPIPAQRLFLALLSSINYEGEGSTFVIKGKDIANLANLPSNVVGQQLQDMSVKADTLRQYTLTIREDDGNDLRVGLISSTKYLKGQRAIRVNVDPYLMPYLRKMKEQFVISYPAGGPMKFRSEFSMPLYDTLLYYLHDGEHYFTLEELRKTFNVADNKYPRTSSFNQKVLQPALKDIGEFTNLDVDVEHKLSGRKILGYTFRIQDKNTTANELAMRQQYEDEQFILKLTTKPYYFNQTTLISLINTYGMESVKNNFKYTLKKDAKNFSAYLNWAISHQVYEKQQEINQLKAVDKNIEIQNTIPKYTEPETNLFEPDAHEEEIHIDYDKLRRDNPRLYSVISRINDKRKSSYINSSE